MGSRRRGFALIIVMIVVAAIFALAMQGAIAVRTTSMEAGAMRDLGALEREASSAANIAIAALVSTARGGDRPDEEIVSDGVDTPAPSARPERPEIPEFPPEMRELLGDLFDELDQEDDAVDVSPNQSSATTRAVETGPFTVLQRVGLPGRAIRVERGGRAFDVRIIDGAGLINLNTVTEEHFRSYLRLMGVGSPTDEAIAHQLLDWREEGDFVRPRGAGPEEHRRRGVTIRNGPLEAIEELLYLPDMTPEIYRRIRTDLTLYGEGNIHAGTAPRHILLSIPGMTAEAADRIIDLRSRGELNRTSLDQALGLLARGAAESLQLELSSNLRIFVEVVDSDMPPFVGETIVTNRRGVQPVALRPAGLAR
ncbi:MAG: hypothetical protein EA376_08580 [Phycisphaeraceae bacterium]|nr:MAG: hypothetical protein EA376_08580 [Phycisphaeraceae bacterium]